MSGLPDLPKDKWLAGTGRQVILKGDFSDIEAAIIASFLYRRPPALYYVGTADVRPSASDSNPANVIMCGFPNILNPGHFVGDTDGRLRSAASCADAKYNAWSALQGAEKANQWYGLFAVAAAEDSDFGLAAHPWLRVKSQAARVISLGSNADANSAIGYSFTTDQHVDALLYVVTGASRGSLRTIIHNNNSGAAGTIEYSGDEPALTLAQGDWFIILPIEAGWRWLGDCYNDNSSNIQAFTQHGADFYWKILDGIALGAHWGAIAEDIKCAPPLGLPWIAAVPHSTTPLPGTAPGALLYKLSASVELPAGYAWEDSGGTVYAPAAVKLPVQTPCSYGIFGSADFDTAVVTGFGWGYPEGFLF